MSDNTNMQNAIAVQQDNALAKRPLEWLAIAEDTFTEAMQKMSQAIIQNCDPTETAMIHNWIKKADKSIKAFHINARDRIAAYILEQGKEVTDKGTLELTLDNKMKIRATPTNTKPDDRKTQQMLRAKGLGLDEHMDKEVSWYANDSKLRQLVDREIMTEAEYKQCFNETKAYRIGSAVPIGENDDE